MLAYGPERERVNLLDIERREQYLYTVFLRAAQLSVEVMGANIQLADLQGTNDIGLDRDHIFLVLKFALNE